MIALRPYQTAAIDVCRERVRAGKRRVLLVSPTGTGKSAMLGAIANGCIDRGGTVDWYAPRVELVDQARQYAPRANITTIQSALKRRGPPPTMRIVDEAHHQVGPEWRTIDDGRSLVIGATATPVEGLGDAFDAIVPAISIREATEQGYLVPCEVIGPDEPLRPGQLAQHPWAAYRAFCDGAQAIVFSSGVEVAEKHAEEFRHAGIPAACIHADSEGRSDIIDRFRSGALRVLTSVAVLTEGFDHPPTSACILARGCGTVSTYLQMVGRVLRPALGKRSALVIDLRGSTLAHGHPSTERTYHLDGVAIRQAAYADGVIFCRICGAIITTPGECGECGAVKEKNFPVIVDKPLRVYAWQRLQSDPPEVRIQRLAKWLGEAKRLEHKAGAAYYKFHACYKQWPTPQEKSEALRHAG